ncbi:MAG: porin family protein [Bacteroidota bacterium]|nr:porin family protein [Bacteroidota bacterium]
MKKIKIIATAVSVSLLSCFYLPATAQKEPLKLELNYNYSIPTGNFKKDMVSNGSPRGFMGSLMYPFSDKWSAGLSYGFQDYYQKYPRALYHLTNTQSISAVLSNSVQTTPILIKAKYFPGTTSFLNPYVSVAAGANIIDYKQYYGEFGNISQSNFGFRAEGGLGVVIPFKKTGTSGLNIGATYDYAPYHKNNFKDLNSINVQAGVEIQLR